MASENAAAQRLQQLFSGLNLSEDAARSFNAASDDIMQIIRAEVVQGQHNLHAAVAGAADAAAGAAADRVAQDLRARPPPPPPAGHARDPEVDMWRHVDRFWKQAPHFVQGKEPFGTYLETWKSAACYVTDETQRKRMLFGCLTGDARSIASRKMNPLYEDNLALSFTEYATKMQELFEPPAESENAKLEFAERQQLTHEDVNTYFEKKWNLFERAWPLAMRDMRYFYDEVTKGLLNEIIKRELWSFEPSSKDDYVRRLKYLAGMVQKRYRAKEINQAETLGATPFTTPISTQPTHFTIKSEPGIHALNDDERSCFYCKKKGHFIKNCPRKLAGLTAPAAAVEDTEPTLDEESVDESTPEEEGNVNFVKNGRAMRGRSFGFRRSPRFTPNGTYRKPYQRPDNRQKQVQFANLKRVGVMYVDGNGVQYVQDVTEEEEDTTTAEEHEEEEGVHTVQLDDQQDLDDYSEVDFMPHPFLGVNPSQ